MLGYICHCDDVKTQTSVLLAYLFCVLLQTTMHRDLYMEALSRISELELDGSSLQNLIQCMQDMRINMVRARYHKHDLL